MLRLALALVLAVCALVARPARAAPTIEDYGKLPAANQMRLSPSGDKLAYVVVDSEGVKVVVRQIGGAVLTAVNAGGLKVGVIDWLDEDHLLIETSATFDLNRSSAVSKTEIGQSTLLNLKTGKQARVFEGQLKIQHATYGYFGHATEGGKTYGYFGGLTLTTGGESFSDFSKHVAYVTHGHTDLFRVDVDTGYGQMASGGTDLHGTGWVLDAAGAIAAHEEYDQRSGHWRLYADPLDAELITEADDPTGDITVLGLGRTAGSILVERPAGRDGDFTRLEYQIGAGAAGTPPFGEAAMKYELRDPGTDMLIGGVTNSDDPKTILFDPALQTKFDKVKRAFPGETVTLASATATLDRMVLYTEGPSDSGTYFLVDYPTKKIEAVAWAYPTILQGAVGSAKIVAYKAADGLALQGVLTLPPGREAKNLPLVVMPHGGPEARDYLGFDWWAQAFAYQGYAVFQPNFRGSDGFGKAFRDAGYGEWGRKMQTDISDGVEELARQGLVDPKRACIVGASYGGYAALAGVTLQRGLYRCAVSFAGIGDLNAFLVWREEKFGVETVVTRHDHLFLGVKSNGDSALKALSPQRLAGHADAPILLIHGKDDSTVPVAQSQDMRDALKAAGKSVEFVELAGEDHSLSSQATRVQMLAASVAFVEKYNPAK